MTPEQVRKNIGAWVRVHNRGIANVSQYNGAKIVGVIGQDALIQPPNHKKPERVDCRTLRLWKTQNVRLGISVRLDVGGADR